MRGVMALVGAHPAVRKVSLVGSRRRGDATKWSDWDLAVDTDDFASVAAGLPALVAPLGPLVAQWDRLSDEQCYMLVLDGPGMVTPPQDLSEAVDAYLVARAEHEGRFGVEVSRELGEQVERLVREQAAELSDPGP